MSLLKCVNVGIDINCISPLVIFGGGFDGKVSYLMDRAVDFVQTNLKWKAGVALYLFISWDVRSKGRSMDGQVAMANTPRIEMRTSSYVTDYMVNNIQDA